MPNPETIVRIKRVGSHIARAAQMQLRCPLPVWDSTGEQIGVAIECDKQMGPISCHAQATFTLNQIEQNDDAKIRHKVELAVESIKANVLVTIRPKEKRKTA